MRPLGVRVSISFEDGGQVSGSVGIPENFDSMTDKEKDDALQTALQSAAKRAVGAARKTGRLAEE